jgi:hypothetical protein
MKMYDFGKNRPFLVALDEETELRVSIIRVCLAQIRFVINVPKQVTKPKGYVATLITLILIISS